MSRSAKAKQPLKRRLKLPDRAGGGTGEQTFFRGRLQVIQDWESLATQACYSSVALARLCGVSLRQLQRHIQTRFGETLGNWLNKLRLKRAYAQLANGCTVKETAFSLGYKQVSHFSRNFKRNYGFSPSAVPITVGLGGPRPPDSDGSADPFSIQLALFDGSAYWNQKPGR